VTAESPHGDGGRPETPPAPRRSLTWRLVLTLLIVGGGLLLLVLPMTLLFHAPHRYAGLASSAVILALVIYFALNVRRRRLEVAAREADEEGEE